ncbi:hypothetical protein [Corallococcus sp. CA053C]|uniref:hypothetical protein n=1 Tax=Corallococcus sp. CA053C TaxID=2316732 RepID=UPI0011C450FD|nr:hypothetical protein [Corallococcus sp. CA053C]
MKRKLITTTVFLLGLAVGGASASASSPAMDAPVPSITPEMAACVYACEQGGQSHTVCWNCCVRNICAEL